MQLQHLRASESCGICGDPGPCPHLMLGSSAQRAGSAADSGGREGGERGGRARDEMQPSPRRLQTFRPGTAASLAPGGASTAQAPPRIEKGEGGGLGEGQETAQGQAAIRQRPEPGSGASHLLLPGLGRKFLQPGREAGGGGSPAGSPRWQSPGRRV